MIPHDPMRQHTYGHASTLSDTAERALGQLIAAYVDATPLQRALITADLRREDIDRFTRRLARATTPEAEADARDALAFAQDELRLAELAVAQCELRERLARPDAVDARRRAA